MTYKRSLLSQVDKVFEAKFFVLRTPLLPFRELAEWGDLARAGIDGDLADTASWNECCRRLRGHLKSIVERPEVYQALFVASPSLIAGLDYWRQDANSKRGRQAERALVRYFARMCFRPTPFGLFSGCSVGQVNADTLSNATTFDLGPLSKYRTTTRLDFDYLFALARSVRSDPSVASQLLWYPNPSLRKVGSAWHYVESRVSGGPNRSHHMVKVESDDPLESVLERAAAGAMIDQIANHLIALPELADISIEDVSAYVTELISNEVLLPTLSPPVTGQSPVVDLIEQMEKLDQCKVPARTLAAARDGIEELDRQAIGIPIQRYQTITKTLAELPAKIDPSRIFQVDLSKPVTSAVLEGQVYEELASGIDLLWQFGQGGEPDVLRTFREAFARRFERAAVPLLEALDEEMGVPFGSTGAESEPLLRGLHLAGGTEGERGRSLHAILQERVLGRSPRGSAEIEIRASDLPTSGRRAMELPSSFSVTATIAAASRAEMEAGKFAVYIKGIIGPDGARLLGRFCHAEPVLEQMIREHLKAEEATNPECVYAEIVYLPEGRIGNVLCRPVLREYEIVCFGRSGAPPERQIPASDLLISVSGTRVKLVSRRLGREVRPRLTNAHGFMNPKLPSVYRLLCYLQHQGVSTPGFSWGQVDSDFLPRVRTGRVVWSTARWRLSKEEIATITKGDNLGRYRAINELRSRRELPRWIVLEESDNSFAVDLENPLLVDSLVHVLKRRSANATLRELYPSPSDLCVSGPEGAFYHELSVPFARRPTLSAPAGMSAERDTSAAVVAPRSARSFAVGSEWTYLKLYGGGALLDDCLTAAIPTVIRPAVRAGEVARWFFLRFSDPYHHLRIRLNGTASVLQSRVNPALTEFFADWLQRGRIWKIQFDTYDRELERYGGLRATEISEEIFCADSEAVVSILEHLEGDAGLEERWRVAAVGIDTLLADFGGDLGWRRAHMEKCRSMFHAEFQVDTAGKRQLSERFRAVRSALEQYLDGSGGQWLREVFARRSAAVRPLVGQLRELDAAGALHVGWEDLISSHLHMHVNRLARSAGRAHEAVLYDFLYKVYDSKIARGKI